MESNPNRSTIVKKPFDKKKWRERKYSNKFKVQKFEEKRKRAVLREYYKELKTVRPKAGAPTPEVPGGGAVEADTNSQPQKKEKKKRLSALHQARAELARQQQEKVQRREEAEKRKGEREEKLREYRAKKAEKFKKLSKKTKKGQPVMKDRLEMLLEKIQRQCASDK